MSEFLLCRDCANFRPGGGLTQCEAERNKRPDYVTGGTWWLYRHAQAARADGTACGPAAKWFAPKVDTI